MRYARPARGTYGTCEGKTNPGLGVYVKEENEEIERGLSSGEQDDFVNFDGTGH